MPLASGEGDHLPTAFGAVLAGDSIGVTVPLFLSGRTIDQYRRSRQLFILIIDSRGGWQLGWPGNIRGPAIPCAYQAGRGREGAARPASSTARMPVRKMPSNVPAPPIEATGAPRSPILLRLRRSAPINVPIDPPI